jgi:ABC-type nickel/cobalt efflux system permease component RcnA
VCFIYGFIHAAGPGHGKLLIGGYGIAVRMTMLRLSGIALLSSLAQGASAVTLVYTGLQLLDLKRTQMIDSAEDIFAPASHAAIALLGVWLIIRGMHRYWRTRGSHSDTHSQACENCGHRHGPSVQEAENVHSLRDLIVLVSAIAIRPCTGALFLLILTWQFNVFAAGVAGTFAMALGTASVTVTIAIAAILFRATTFQHIPGRTATRIIPAIEIIMGAIICITAVRILTAIL